MFQAICYSICLNKQHSLHLVMDSFSVQNIEAMLLDRMLNFDFIYSFGLFVHDSVFIYLWVTFWSFSSLECEQI